MMTFWTSTLGPVNPRSPNVATGENGASGATVLPTESASRIHSAVVAGPLYV